MTGRVRFYECPECGRVIETIAVEVWCNGKPPNWHKKTQRCTEVGRGTKPTWSITEDQEQEIDRQIDEDREKRKTGRVPCD
jgi:hypothetical protein